MHGFPAQSKFLCIDSLREIKFLHRKIKFPVQKKITHSESLQGIIIKIFYNIYFSDKLYSYILYYIHLGISPEIVVKNGNCRILGIRGQRGLDSLQKL